MKLVSKSLILALALVLVLSFVPSANAMIVVLDPEESAPFYLEYTGVSAIEGEIIFSDPSIISNVKYDLADSGMSGLVENGRIFLYTDNPDGVDGKIGITVTIHSGAPKGSSCTITFQYATTAPGSTTPGGVQKVTHTVTVRTDGSATLPPEPTDPDVKYADTKALREQISIAENLTYYDYTKESWASVDQALKTGKSLLYSTDQSRVDKATNELKVALANLVAMDYSELQEALDSAADMNKHEEIAALWSRFLAALENARIQRTSGDQAAVDAAAEELVASKKALLKGLEEMGELVVVEKEVEVEKIVEPDYPFCNRVFHVITLVGFILSFLLNGALVLVIGLYFFKKVMNKRDTTPLVAYDISDDVPDLDEEDLE